MAALEERATRGIYDAEWKRLRMACVEMEFVQRPNLWNKEEERAWYRERESNYCDHVIAAGDYGHKRYREKRRTRPKGRQLPWYTPNDTRLIALARRLGAAPEKYCPLTRDGKGFVDPDSPMVDRLWEDVGRWLILLQPEFERITFTSGRPPGARNKQIKTEVTKEALRQHRRRQKKRDKYSR
jgi:hypothetical protein